MTAQQQQPAKQCLNHRGGINVTARLSIWLIAVLCGLTLSGCGDFFDEVADLLRINGSDVEAQEDSVVRIEMLTIQTDSFSIEVDEDINMTPTVTVEQGGVIQFTMQSEGRVRFTTSGSSMSQVLEMGDRVLLQTSGTTGVMTFIRED